MLIVMKKSAAQIDVDRVLTEIEKAGLSAQIFDNFGRTTFSVKNNGAFDFSQIQNFTGVEIVTEENKIENKNFPPKKIISVGDEKIGDGSLTMIAGVCSVESREQTFAVAETVKQSGAKFFRGGAFKPRTSPLAFQGLGEKGLQILAEVREKFGLKIVTEAIDERAVELVENYADILQIGSRNMQNFSLLRRAGRSNLPVLLKRGMSATLEDFLHAAEYILNEGNENVILCERGIRTFATHSRNTLDLSIVPAIRQVSDLPVIVDPSHGTGKNFMVAPLALAGAAVGADGLIIEIHPQPEIALSDGAQALLPEEFLKLSKKIKVLHDSLTKPVANFTSA